MSSSIICRQWQCSFQLGLSIPTFCWVEFSGLWRGCHQLCNTLQSFSQTHLHVRWTISQPHFTWALIDGNCPGHEGYHATGMGCWAARGIVGSWSVTFKWNSIASPKGVLWSDFYLHLDWHLPLPQLDSCQDQVLINTDSSAVSTVATHNNHVCSIALQTRNSQQL